MHRPRRLLALACVAALAVIASPVAHTQIVVRSGVDLVRVTTTVTDAGGRFVNGLGKDDFTVLDDGQPQDIVSFTSQRVPVSLGIVLDASVSMKEKLRTAHAAIRHLTLNLLGPEDELFLASFNVRTWLHQPWTKDRRILNAALDKPLIGPGTTLYDAVALTLSVASTGQHPKKALLVLSDGDDVNSTTSIKDLQQVIRASDVLVYALGVKGTGNDLHEGNLRRMTDETGGRTEIVTSFRNLQAATARIADELNRQYVIGYATPHDSDNKWHTIQVKIRKPGARARARAGYVASDR